TGRVEKASSGFQYFRDRNSLEQRKEMALLVRNNNNEYIPVIVEKVAATPAPSLDRCKFLIHKKTGIVKFIGDMRSLLTVPAEQQLYFFVAGRDGWFHAMTPGENEHLLMAKVYNEYHDEEDGFLYITYSTSSAQFAYYPVGHRPENQSVVSVCTHLFLL